MVYSYIQQRPKIEKSKSSCIIGHKSIENTHWEYITEWLLTVNIKIFGENIAIVAVNAPTIKNEFKAILIEVISKIEIRKEIILKGDLNGRTGSRKDDKAIGQYGEQTFNM